MLCGVAAFGVSTGLDQAGLPSVVQMGAGGVVGVAVYVLAGFDQQRRSALLTPVRARLARRRATPDTTDTTEAPDTTEQSSRRP